MFTNLYPFYQLSVEDLFSKYDSTLQCLLDKHLPVRKVRKRIEPLTPWFDCDCIKAKRNKRRLERAYHRTGLVVDRVRWTKAIRDMHTLFNSKERVYWETKVTVAASNSKKRWQILNKLMCKDVKSQILDSATAEAFSKFFSHKVESVRSATVLLLTLLIIPSCLGDWKLVLAYGVLR